MSEIHRTLQGLTETIGKVVGEAIKNKTIKPEHEIFWQWKVNKFDYTDSGITSFGAEGDYVTKETWFRASVELQRRILDLPEFKTALKELTKAFPAVSQIPRYLEKFVLAILDFYLSNSTPRNSSEVEKFTARFVNDLADGPVNYRAKVEVEGITLRSEKISLDPSTAIRQPKKEDLEVIIRPMGFLQPSPKNPSAIIEIQYLGARGQSSVLQTKVEQCVALLRLFNVGSVKWSSYGVESDSMVDWMSQGTLTSGVKWAALERYVIKKEDEPRLKSFWDTMSISIPKDIYDFRKQVSHTTLAYDRYSDALLQNGIIERRIANAVMGFEALFLEETLELSYRLGMRASKVLSLLGKNPLEVRRVFKDAYGIRSAFAHGSHLTYKAKKKLETKYGEVKKLLHVLLDYLRASIIMMVVCRMGKDEVIDLIDDALIDSTKHEILKNKVAGVRTIAFE